MPFMGTIVFSGKPLLEAYKKSVSKSKINSETEFSKLNND